MAVEIHSYETPTLVYLPDGRSIVLPPGQYVELGELLQAATLPPSPPPTPAPIPGLDDPGGDPVLFAMSEEIDPAVIREASQGGRRTVVLRSHNVREFNAMALHDLAEQTRGAHVIVELR
jgi:hypothetical protein